MRLLCLGDIALADQNINKVEWSTPIGIKPDGDEKILFNWELPIGEKLNAMPRLSGPRLSVHPQMLKLMRCWSPGFAALATNHMLDAGPEGLRQTLLALHQAGYTTVGAGQVQDEITQPLIWETREGRLAVISWVFPETLPDWMAVPGPNCWPGIEEATHQIQSLKKTTDWVLLFIHWSDEAFPYPRLADRETARNLLMAGADMIIGHHPHVVRGIEIINGCPVFYSLGNFFFSNIPVYQTSGLIHRFSQVIRPVPRNREALGVQVTFRHSERPEYHPLAFWQGPEQTLPDPSQRAVRRMQQMSRPLGQFAGEKYAEWYRSQRARFDKIDYRLNFSFYQLGWNGLLRYPFQLLRTALKNRR